MFWLFGQIWLWLLFSFALGAVTTWLLMRAAQRERPRSATEPASQPAGEPAGEPEPYREPVPPHAEQTQYIPAPQFAESEPLHDYRFPEDEPAEPDGHREGRLPMPPPRAAPADDWPSEEQPAWPESEDMQDTRQMHRWPPPAPHQPGRGG